MEHRPLVKVRPYMDVLLSSRGVPGIGVPPIMRETGVRFFCTHFPGLFWEESKTALGPMKSISRILTVYVR